MNKTFLYFILGVTLCILLVGVYFLSKPASTTYNLQDFTSCLKEKKATMYGAYWCPHCQRQKKLFGEYVSNVPYVECTKEVKRCEKENIQGYPTWVFEDGSRQTGEMTLQQLAEKTSCSLY